MVIHSFRLSNFVSAKRSGGSSPNRHIRWLFTAYRNHFAPLGNTLHHLLLNYKGQFQQLQVLFSKKQRKFFQFSVFYRNKSSVLKGKNLPDFSGRQQNSYIFYLILHTAKYPPQQDGQQRRFARRAAAPKHSLRQLFHPKRCRTPPSRCQSSA